MSLVAVRSWTAEVLAGHRLAICGELEVVKDRPWSLVAKVPTENGVCWFKENRGATGYEAALGDALGRWAPGRVLRPLGVEVEKAWCCCPTAGPPCGRSAPCLTRANGS